MSIPGGPGKGGGGFKNMMHSLKDKMKETHVSAEDTHASDLKIRAVHLKHQIGKFGNLFNPNHRHDEKHEQETDEQRSKIAESHRFGSFAPERDGNKVKWYVDGRNYYWAVSEALERAKETIYIADWWLSPELFLRRPPYYEQEWRLDQVLKRRAEAGVKIYIIVYKEVEAAVTCNSNHTKQALRALCPKGSPGFGNITVMRHPDHNVFENVGDMTFYWAHHEKFIVIDYDVAFIGGLDLCFGRWDTHQHPLADVSPEAAQNTIFPGQDYNNNRIMDFQSVNDWKNNQLDKTSYGRMPWHDVSMGLVGPCVYDIAEHFILRWNFCKRDKYKRDPRFDWLELEGRDNEQDEALVGVQRPQYPVGEYIKHPLSGLGGKRLTPDQGTVHAQIVRSSADWSSGILTEQSIQNAWKQVIREAKHYVYIENQFFITATGDQQKPIHNTIGEAIVDAVVRAAREDRRFRVIINIPAIPGFAGDLRADAAAGTRAIMDYQFKSINRGEHSIYGRIKAAGFDPTKYIFVFNLRSYDRINNTPGMKEQEAKSGVKYQDVQRAIAEEIMGGGIHGVKKTDTMRTSKLRPWEKKERSSSSEDSGEEEKEEMMDRRRRFEAESSKGQDSKGDDMDGDNKPDSVDSIAKDAMLNEPKVSEEVWNREHPEQENENFIQEELYIHDKVCIVDDRIVICGSANINDRSQLGYHDSELCIVMEDSHLIDSRMDGQPYKAGHHAASLRRTLWREHLGLLPAQPMNAHDDPNAQPPDDAPNDVNDDGPNGSYSFVEDPLSEDLWQMWTSRATQNTETFRHLFHADPDDHILTFDDYEKFLPRGAGRKQGHLFDQYMPVEDVKRNLDKIKGHLVWMPLEFLRDAQMAERGLALNEYTESIYT